MKKLVILLSVFTLTACSTQSKPVEHKEKHKVVKVKKKKLLNHHQAVLLLLLLLLLLAPLHLARLVRHKHRLHQ
uniref:hypothetical protein n=1 Tax=Streptococcus parauberis TaxID=1348 RepID=UPI000559FCF5|nr:hypothetical protein [Streptococcus parauberis]